MTPADDEEFRALRVRAYGPNADIHLDAGAVDRLRELENERRASPLPDRDGAPLDVSAPAEQPVLIEQPDPVEQEAEREPKHFLRWLAGLRRSTVLLVLGLAVVAAVIVVALLLVQRVQAAPLQPDASQVARLTIDRSYEIPETFVGSFVDPNGGESAFQDFHGVRTLVTPGGFLGLQGDESCLMLLKAPVGSDASSTSLDDYLTGGCGAGKFPATGQFRLDSDGVPSDLRSAFPDATALQFVYDPVNREVVVFADN